MPHESEAFQMLRSVGSLVVGLPRAQPKQASSLVKTNRAHIHARRIAQITDLHRMPLIATQDCILAA